jgi:hypothetical protein
MSDAYARVSNLIQATRTSWSVASDGSHSDVQRRQAATQARRRGFLRAGAHRARRLRGLRRAGPAHGSPNGHEILGWPEPAPIRGRVFSAWSRTWSGARRRERPGLHQVQVHPVVQGREERRAAAHQDRVSDDRAVASATAHPLTVGHTLVIPRRYVLSVFEVSETERANSLRTRRRPWQWLPKRK